MRATIELLEENGIQTFTWETIRLFSDDGDYGDEYHYEIQQLNKKGQWKTIDNDLKSFGEAISVFLEHIDAMQVQREQEAE